MTDAPPRGHRVVDHTADEILEAWGPTRAAALEEAVRGFVELFAHTTASPTREVREHLLDGRDDDLLLLDILEELLVLADADGGAPRRVDVEDRGHQVQLTLEVVDLERAEATGPAPKGVARPRLVAEEGRWVASALVDV